jgi:hypothetical protein
LTTTVLRQQHTLCNMSESAAIVKPIFHFL